MNTTPFFRTFSLFFLISSLLIFSSFPSVAQKDTIKEDLSFDLGITRGRNINLWPILKISRTPTSKDVMMLFYLYGKNYDLREGTRHSHILPFYWKDSTATLRDLRLFSIYYPSLIRHVYDGNDSIKSFRFMEFAPKVSLLEISSSPNGLFIDNNFLFLLWYKNDVKAKKEFLVTFPVYWYFRNGDRKTNTLFPLYSYGNITRDKKYFAVTPLFWHTQEKDKSTNVLFPVYWNKSSGTGKTRASRHLIYPVYYQYKDSIFNNKVVFPVIWSYKNPNYSSFTFFPLVFAGKTPDKQTQHVAVTPLFWHLKNGDRVRNFLFPVFWNSKTGTGAEMKTRNVLFPVFWNYKDSLRKNTVIFPISYRYKNPYYQSYTFLPLMSAGHTPDKSRSHLTLTPLFWHFRNGDRISNTLFPILFNRQSGTGNSKTTRNVIFPVFWQYQDSLTDNKVLFPLSWSYKNPYYQSFTFLPFYSAGHTPDWKQHYFAVTPAFWHVQNDDVVTNTLLPVWFSRQSGVGGSKTIRKVLFPVFWQYQDSLTDNKVLFPLSWSYRNPYYQSFTFLPFVSTGHTTDNQRSHLAVTPLFWHFRDKDRISNTLFPIWYNRQSGTGGSKITRNILFPVFWQYQDSLTDNKVLFPLSWSYKNPNYQSFTFLPFVSTGHTPDRQRQHLAITLLFWHFQNKDRISNTLFPIWYNRQSGTGGSKVTRNILFPVFWQYKDSLVNNKVFFPISWSYKNPYYQSFTFLPFVSAGHTSDNQRQHLAVTPIFWHFQNKDRISNTLFPIWFNRQSGTGGSKLTRNILFPVFWQYKDSLVNNKVFFPISWSYKNPYYQSFTFLPFVSTGHTPDRQRQHLAITPLFWHFKNYDRISNTLFPIWYNRQSGTGGSKVTRNILFPVFWQYQDSLTDNKVLFPLSWSYKNPYYQSFTVLPFISMGHSADKQQSHLVITPLFWHHQNKDQVSNLLFPILYNSVKGTGGSKITRNVIFPVFWQYQDSLTDNKVLFPLSWSYKNPYYQSFTFLPFFSTGRSPVEDKNHLVITPLFWHVKDKDKITNAFVPLWWSWKEGTGSQKKVRDCFFPLYWHYADSLTNDKMLLPLYFSLKEANYQSVTLLPLFSKGQSQDGQRAHLTITPLFWHFKMKDETRNLLFPLWFNKQLKNQSDTIRLNNFALLFWNYKHNDWHTNVVFPVSWYLKDNSFKSYTFLPLYSSLTTTDKSFSYHAITPLFWHIHNKDKNRTSLFPLFGYRTQKDDYKFHLVYLLFRKSKEGTHRKTSLLWPLVHAEKDTNFSYFRAVPIVWYKRTASTKFFSIQPFYYHSLSPKLNAYHFLWQLYVHEDYPGLMVQNNILWKTLYWNRYTNGDHEFRFLYLFLANISKNGNIEKSYFPFYYHSKQKNGNESLAIMLSFYNRFKQQVPGTTEFYHEERIFWLLRLRSNYKKLKAEGKISSRSFK
jgi:hypothetical protein